MSSWAGDDAPLISPKRADAFGPHNIVLSGANTRHHVASFSGPLSLKGVQHGEVEWRVGGVGRLVRRDTLLLLPDGAEYAMTIDSPRPSRTFCQVFRRGLVEAALSDLALHAGELLDRPDEAPAEASFAPRWETRSGALGQAVDALAAGVAAKASPEALGWCFVRLAARTAETIAGHRQERLRLSALRAATRFEIQRRLVRACDAMEDNLAAPWPLTEMASSACMSMFHFNRCFREAFGETPRAWLSRRRSERAMGLLRTSDISVTEVCFTVGYRSLGSFSAAFQRRFGQPPSRYKLAVSAP
jgi:AraC family transcriptional regulator